MTISTVRLFVGDTIDVPSERELISRLRVDLESRGLRATLYANFFAAEHKPPQVDLLVRTDHRTMHVEVKGLHPDRPVRARSNGSWVQLLPDGTERDLGSNAGRQALKGTYAISDAMRALARRGQATAASADFYRCIDTVVGVWKDVPSGSDIKAPPHVAVLGYEDLLDRLGTPGPVVPWSDEDWDAFALRLELYQPDADSEAELARRAQLDAIGDYRHRLRSSLQEGLVRLVDIGSTDAAATELSAADVRRMVSSGRMVALACPSGTGKSFLARHIAADRLGEGCMVVWLRAGEYEKGHFRRFLAQAMGPYSVETWRTLFRAATETGTPIAIVVDGLNECPTDARTEMLERLRAFQLRYPASVLMTSTSTDDVQGASDSEILRLNPPDEGARLEILKAHGARNPDRLSAHFRTPYELAVAARCEQELPETASVTEVEAAYIRQLAPTEQIRSGLRALASRMHSRLRTSLSLQDAIQVLKAPSLGMRASQIDAVLDCRLLTVDQHRVRFGHELFGQFLAAEDLVHQSGSGQSLGRLLGAPGNIVLAQTALSIEGDYRRVWDAVLVLADADLFAEAAGGAFGPAVAQLAINETRRILRTVIVETESGAAELVLQGTRSGRWVTGRQWSETELALLISAGRGLTRGHFVDEICDVVDATDRLCLRHASRLRADGERQPISRIFEGTYAQSAAPTDGRGLGASYLVRAFEFSVMGRRFSPNGPAPGVARRLVSGAGQWSWGRFHLAALCVDPREAADQEFFASLLNTAWNAKAYHLRLSILDAAQYFHDSEEPLRSEVLEQISQFDTDHPLLRSAIVDVLVSFGEIENPVTAEELRADIRETIAHAQDTERCAKACSIISFQFEPESIFGPYFEAIEGLTERERVRLLTMAARGAGPNGSFHLDWILDELVKILPAGDPELDDDAKSVLRIFIDEPIPDFRVHPAAEDIWLTAILGWAKFESALPPPPQSDGAIASPDGWRNLATIFFGHAGSCKPDEIEEAWEALLQDPTHAVPNLARLEHATFGTDTHEGHRRLALAHLIEHHPDTMRRLFETALDQDADSEMSLWNNGLSHQSFAMRILGAVGTEETAALLEPHTVDPETGVAAVEAIRQINHRSDS